jgi:hypothetical protein
MAFECVCAGDLTTRYRHMRHLTLHGFDQIYKITHQTRFPDCFMNELQTSQLEEARQAALLGYHFLSKTAADNNIYCFHIIPKLHKLDHMLRRSIRTGLSASLFWTFVLESEMSLAAKVIGSCHAASSMRRGIQKCRMFRKGTPWCM